MGVHVSTARALLLQSRLPTCLWAEAIRFSVWLHNRQFTTSVPTLKTPLEIASSERPNLGAIQPWGSKILVKDLNAGKLDSRVREGRYLGPDEESLGVRVYWPEKRTVTVEREVYYNTPKARFVAVEGESKEDEDDSIYVFNDDNPSSSNRQPQLSFPQEDDEEDGEFFATPPPSPTIPPPNPPNPPFAHTNEIDEDDDMPELADYSDSEDEEDGEEEEGDDDFFDDKKVEKVLLREEEERADANAEEESPTQSPTTQLPVVDEPLQRRSAEPTQHDEGNDEPQPTSTRSRRNVAPAPGFYKETRTYNRRDSSKTGTGIPESQLATLVAELDEALGQEGISLGRNADLVAALAKAMAVSSDSDDPTYEDALAGPEKEKWLEAIREEVAQIEKMHTYDVVEVDRRDIANIIGCRFVLRRKRDAQGNVSRYKARLVGKGYSQRPGIDFNETFAPTIRPVTLRYILSLGATLNAAIEQADAKNAYLNGVLPPNEIIYMHLPPILFEIHPELRQRLTRAKSDGKSLVLRLWRPLYGTKQGGNKWYEELCFTLSKLGLTKSNADHALFYRVTSPNNYCLLGVATDDFTFVANSKGTVKALKGGMGEFMELVDMGELTWILGVDVRRDLQARTISLSQTAYINHILELFGMTDCKSASTPLQPGIDLTPGSEHVSSTLLLPYKKTKYRELIGLLMYLNVMTRPDIAEALSVLARFLESPHTTHMESALHVVRYLKSTKDFRLTLGGKDFILTGYSDANWGTELHRHSISGYTFSTGAGVISWSSKKQPIITLSSTESEYVALTHAAKETKWLRSLSREILPIVGLGAYVENFRPTILYCDNQGAIKLSTNPVFHARTKHIDIHFHFIRQTITSRDIQLIFCPTDYMVADAMTKPLGRVKFAEFRKSMGVLGPDDDKKSDARIEGEC
ncbi:hypothetical protein EST38_g10703 [Candolleomyces aberdarensis]|uniref:Uncharacterized protein n=1 Tax=Candolleomyces aberdarensis TaxID=2316362 RepID=A0A4Q2D8Z2_9AGAR|nr:hypothetical protein EST38_g10703 [Candolleomyces aberdarensis]